MSYAEIGSKALRKNYHQVLSILIEDFEVNFAEPNTEPMIEFMRTELNLTMNRNRTEATTN